MTVRKFKVGDSVRLRKIIKYVKKDRPPFNVGRIEIFFNDIDGGVRLDAPLGGHRCWNVKDLARAK